jgi:flagellar motility protein MotE (MotC chaperone)
MKKIVMILVVGGVIFGASMGVSTFLQNRQHPVVAAEDSEEKAEEHGEADAHGKPHGAETHGSKEPAPTEHASNSHSENAHGEAEKHSPAHGKETKDTGPPPTLSKENALPATNRPSPVSVEELLRYSLGLKSREESLAQRDRDLERRQSQMNIVLADIQGEQRELDGMRTQVGEQMNSVREMLKTLEEDRTEFEAQQARISTDLKQLQSSQEEMDAGQRENVKKMSAWFQSMEPEKAAEVLTKLSNDGKLDLAVQLLASFEPRDASKILSAIEDTTLTVQLAEAFRTHKKQPAKKDDKKK